MPFLRLWSVRQHSVCPPGPIAVTVAVTVASTIAVAASTIAGAFARQ
jgi:hypothetical protein